MAMASRIARRALTSALTRPAMRAASTSSTPTPTPSQTPATAVAPNSDAKKTAESIIDMLPGSSLVSKTAIMSSIAGLSTYAISNEYYVLNEETVVAFCLLSVWTALIKYGGPAYAEFGKAYTDKINGILNQARADHTAAVKERIGTVEQMSSVVEMTRDLFAVSKETAQLEAQAFELEQRTAIAAEAKSVLDSWVRYEGQVKARQQKELAESVISRITKELENPRTLQQILQQSVTEVEKIMAKRA